MVEVENLRLRVVDAEVPPEVTDTSEELNFVVEVSVAPKEAPDNTDEAFASRSAGKDVSPLSDVAYVEDPVGLVEPLAMVNVE